MKCISDRLLVNLNKLNKKNENKSNNENEQIEGFFGGLGSWFSGSTPSNLPAISPGSLPTENIHLLEKKITDSMISSSSFPPTDNDNEFKDSDNSDILNLSKPFNSQNNLKNNSQNNLMNNITALDNTQTAIETTTKLGNIISKEISQNTLSNAKVNEEFQAKPSLGKCQFYNDKCPDKYHNLGNFSIEGVGSGAILKCGNIQDTSPASAIAEIKNNSIYEIHVRNQGKGYNPSKPPSVKIEGGKGEGAKAEALIDDNGSLKIIKVTNAGNGYTDTPNVMIDAPYMNSSCHLCCSDES
jgi:hypothetical protein